ncbi:PP2C family protein-serine/threonine phosphatase [Actinomadura rubrisoli]|uniref:Serine/threonine-protein phosphatase n=1 Tax=Actinomadura rubrisoli TaxID=2530368 RepID=A0A4R5B141_9ACTN|nr:PP2C family protein-serine/threonine phosphatase [Actinomadura rubrisoli]TDD79311.1 serine/threonine-protein phosphatase [Actinomadura rubrisoli]
MHPQPGSDGLVETVEQAIWAARPHELVGTAAELIGRHAGAAEAEVLLIDYRHAFLVPAARGGDPVRVDDGSAGRAFAAQRTVREKDGHAGGHRVHLPLSVRGERLGLLTVRFPDGGVEPAWLPAVATALARALKIAESGTDLYRRIRRRTRLTLAAEMQWDLLPSTSYEAAEFSIAGQLEPAYAVWGDNFDWAASDGRLTLTVSNGMGSGTEAAALTHLAVSALRNARRSGGDITEQAALADQALYAQHRGDLNVATLLLDFDMAGGRVRAIDAGSPRIYRMRGNVTEGIEFDAQLPLGMFGDTLYAVEEFSVEPGDRLFVVSDGVHAALSPGGETYGVAALLQALRDTRLQAPPEAVRTIIRHFITYHEGAEPVDDAVIVCLDWIGTASSPSSARGDIG